VVAEGLKVIELAPGVTREFLQSKTGVNLLSCRLNELTRNKRKKAAQW